MSLWFNWLLAIGIWLYKKSHTKSSWKVTVLMLGQGLLNFFQHQMILFLIFFVFCQSSQITNPFVKNSIRKNNLLKLSPASSNFTKITSTSSLESLTFLRKIFFNEEIWPLISPISEINCTSNTALGKIFLYVLTIMQQVNLVAKIRYKKWVWVWLHGTIKPLKNNQISKPL